jgi:hypothetical protein
MPLRSSAMRGIWVVGRGRTRGHKTCEAVERGGLEPLEPDLCGTSVTLPDKRI